MKFVTFTAALVALLVQDSSAEEAPQTNLRRQLNNPAPDCSSEETGFQTCKNNSKYFECLHGKALTRPVSPGTKCCVTSERAGRIFPVHASVECPPSPPSYDAEFVYPKKLPPPPELWIEGFASRLQAKNIQKYETPIQVWQVWRLDQVMWNCIAHYHPTALHAITKQAPTVRAPEKYHTSEARALCMIHAINKVIPELVPISTDEITGWLDEVGMDSSIMTDEEALQLASEGNPSPKVIGSLVAYEVCQDMLIDGWNYNGAKLKDDVDCTANRRPFTDTYGYEPKNSPWKLSHPNAWQPLIESNEIGFFYAQEHVTPHIGFKAKPVVMTRDEVDARVLPDPNYDYEEEAAKVIEKVSYLDNYRKTMIKFMDNKINLGGGLMRRIRGMKSLSLEAQVYFHFGYASAEHDVVLLAWKEKVRHDRVRPTSVVQAMGDVEVTSFAGNHAARDWVPYIRVMPHAEYPSGSGCICIAAAQYIDAFLSDLYNEDTLKTTWEFENIEPVTFESLKDLVEVCGQSRLWGGMHFEASVPDSYTLCDGVGARGYTDVMKPLLGDGTYSELMDETKMKYEGDVFKEYP